MLLGIQLNKQAPCTPRLDSRCIIDLLVFMCWLKHSLICSCTGDTFTSLADEYLRIALRKGVPSLFVNVRGLYTDEERVITRLFVNIHQSIHCHADIFSMIAIPGYHTLSLSLGVCRIAIYKIRPEPDLSDFFKWNPAGLSGLTGYFMSVNYCKPHRYFIGKHGAQHGV